MNTLLDEAQAIKNPDTDAAKAARLLRGRHRLALSGTPVENHLGELWSLFEFLNPGMLGAASLFRLEGNGARNPFLLRLFFLSLKHLPSDPAHPCAHMSGAVAPEHCPR